VTITPQLVMTTLGPAAGEIVPFGGSIRRGPGPANVALPARVFTAAGNKRIAFAARTFGCRKCGQSISAHLAVGKQTRSAKSNRCAMSGARPQPSLQPATLTARRR
jgi:hypothetical protein